jgi:acyl dehydratase
MYQASELQAGQVFHSGQYEMTRERITAFSSQFDPQPFHLRDEPGSPFPTQIASGWHTAAVTMRLFLEALPLTGDRVGSGVELLEWPRPVRVGDRLQVRVTILEVRGSRSKPGMTVARVLIETLNQNGEIVQSMQPNVLVLPPTRAEEASGASPG